VAIPTGVIGDTLIAAIVTLFNMAAERVGAANLDGSHSSELLARQLVSVAVQGSVLAKDMSDFQSGAAHDLGSGSASNGLRTAATAP